MGCEQKPLISVIVPVYNTEKYLHQCIDSIVAQDYKNLEIILVDDGSTDSCPTICDEYAEKDHRIKVIHKENGGLTSARKAGLRTSTGNYIAHVDSDDWIEPHTYSAVYQYGIQYDVDLAVIGNCIERSNNVRNMDSIQISKGIYIGNEIKEKIWPTFINTEHFFSWGVHLYMWNHIFKRNIALKNYMQVDEGIKLGEDVAGCMPCYFSLQSLAVVGGNYYHYRQHESSIKHTVKHEEYIALRSLLHYLLRRAEETCTRECMEKKIVYLVFYELLMSSYGLFLDKKNNLLEPYHIEKGKRIVIYGAGVFGTAIYKVLKETEFCTVILWVDSNAELYGEEVVGPETVHGIEYDYILLAALYSDTRDKMRDRLLYMDVLPDKIVDIDKDFFTLANLEKVLNRDFLCQEVD